MARPGRPARPTTALEVVRREQLTPHLVRVHFTGDLAAFAASTDTDRYVKLVFELPDGPVLRTYTVRSLDVPAGTLAIDFVVHGDHGVAGVWAARAEPGDVLQARGPGGGYAPDPDVDWHLFAGDETALPAIAAALEQLPSDAVARVLIEVEGPDEVLGLEAPEGVEVEWVLRGFPAADAPDDRSGTEAPLVHAVRAVDWLPGRVQAFVHGEAQAVMHGIRPWLLGERALPRMDVSVSGYWRRGRTEEGFRAWKSDLARAEQSVRPSA